MGALIFGITGFGAALVTIPLATHVVPLKFALALFVLADLSSAIRVGFENPRKVARDEWVRLVPMILVGTALGVTLLVNLPRDTATLLLGNFILAFALYSLVPHRTKLVSVHWAWLAGLAGGLTSTLFRAGSAPPPPRRAAAVPENRARAAAARGIADAARLRRLARLARAGLKRHDQPFHRRASQRWL